MPARRFGQCGRQHRRTPAQARPRQSVQPWPHTPGVDIGEHQAAVAMHRLDDGLRPTQRGDDDRRAVTHANGQIGLQTGIAAMRHQVHSPGADAGLRGAGERGRECREPAIEDFAAARIAAGSAPTMPARQAASTSAGPETRNMGAAITGSASCSSMAAGRREREEATLLGMERRSLVGQVQALVQLTWGLTPKRAGFRSPASGR